MSKDYIPIKVLKRAVDGIDRARQCDMATSYDYTLKRAIEEVLRWIDPPDYKESERAAEASAEVRPIVRGHWKEEDIGYDPYVTCSECGLSLGKGCYNEEEWREVLKYCPCCGADMREEVEKHETN